MVNCSSVSAAIASTSICARTLTRHASGHIIADGEEAAAVAPEAAARSWTGTPAIDVAAGVVAQLLCKRIPKGRCAVHEILLQHEALPNTIRSGQIANIRGIIESGKDELLVAIMERFSDTFSTAWDAVLAAPGSVVERLDALMWVNINLIDRFSEEFKIQLAWLRQSPPDSVDLGLSFGKQLRQLVEQRADWSWAAIQIVEKKPKEL